MIIDNGKRIFKEEEKSHYFWSKFKDLFAPESQVPNSVGDWSVLFHARRVTNPDLLTIPFDIDEIKKAVFQLGGDKAPGPDGFPISFYQTFWDVVKNDIWLIFHELYEGRLTTRAIDYTYICLILKKKVW